MKQLRVLVFAIFFLFGVVIPVLAQEDVAPRDGVRQTIQDKRQEVRCQVAGVHGRRLEHRFTIYYQRLTKMSVKMQNRIDRLEEDGKDMSEAQALMDEAMVKLEEANIKGQEAIVDFSEIEDGDCLALRDQALAASDLALEVRELFKEVISLFKQVFELVKVASQQE